MSEESDKLKHKHDAGETLGELLRIPRLVNGRWRIVLGDKSSAGLYDVIIDLAFKAKREVENE